VVDVPVGDAEVELADPVVEALPHDLTAIVLNLHHHLRHRL
jgi:hypothetical protein